MYRFYLSLHIAKIISIRTNIELDEHLIQTALQISKLKTKKDVVHEALKQYIASMKRKNILSLREKGTWEGNLDQLRSL
ncbi:type II toxin-antitoxin system VapB family antitoxin [Olivibacter ginsenosidimutans]|uniref:Type II toxin-antitoxin system VapB family antitoxin n=1 Tax=Olivibacter ginsenosidimutans TaxID=1176537 RepID=A0ABP9BPG2_9SPHI